MKENKADKQQNNYWLIQAESVNKQNRLNHFFEEGIWVNSDYDKNAFLVNKIRKNDIIALKTNYIKEIKPNKFVSGVCILATGEVKRNYQDGKNLEISWSDTKPHYIENIVKPESMQLITDKNEIGSIFYPEKKREITQKSAKAMLNDSKSSKYPLNQVYFGASGTGKTYKAITTALEIIDGFVPDDENMIKEKFEYYQKHGRIAMITMHPTLGYEELVESLKPFESKINKGQIEYKLKDGTIKKIANIARAEISGVNADTLPDIYSKKTKFFKVSLGTTSEEADNLIYDYCLENDCLALDMLGGIDYSILENTSSWQKAKEEISEVYFSSEEEEIQRVYIQAIYFFKNYMRVNDIFFVSNDCKNITAIGRVNGWYEYRDIPGLRNHHFKKVEWLAKDCHIPIEKFYKNDFSSLPIYQLSKSNLVMDNIANFLSNNHGRAKNYVLIIDEIDQVKITNVLGELNTLMDTKKRVGNAEELLVNLPFSNEKFGLPNNLYIIGTMSNLYNKQNIEILRRRFDFIETSVDYTKIDIQIDGIAIAKLLKAINQRINYLLNSFYEIGHTYFIDLIDNPSFEMLQNIIQNKIIPLLRDYFNDDWAKIRLILGDNQKRTAKLQFIQEKEFKAKDLFGEKLENSESQKIYHINCPVEPKAYIGIYQKGKK